MRNNAFLAHIIVQSLAYEDSGTANLDFHRILPPKFGVTANLNSHRILPPKVGVPANLDFHRILPPKVWRPRQP